jgi:hypothetical protein
VTGRVPEVLDELLADRALATELAAPPEAAAVPFAHDHSRCFLAIAVSLRNKAPEAATVERVVGAIVRRLHASGRLTPYGGVEITLFRSEGTRSRRVARVSVPTLAVEQDPEFESFLSNPEGRDIAIAWFEPPAERSVP